MLVRISDAHLMGMGNLRKLGLLFEEFPKNHNLILSGQPALLTNLVPGLSHRSTSTIGVTSVTALNVNHDQSGSSRPSAVRPARLPQGHAISQVKSLQS